MKKGMLVVIAAFFSLVLCACGTPEITETQIREDFGRSVKVAGNRLKVESVTVDKIASNEENDQSEAKVTIEAANDTARLRGCYTMQFRLLDQKWTLDNIDEAREDGWQIEPLSGVPQNEAEAQAGKGFSVVDATQNLTGGQCSFRLQKNEDDLYCSKVSEVGLLYRFDTDTLVWVLDETDEEMVSTEWDILGMWETIPASGTYTSGWSANISIEITTVNAETAHVIANAKGGGGKIFEADVALDPVCGINCFIENPYDAWESFTLVIAPDEAKLEGTGMRSAEKLVKSDSLEKPEFETPALTDMTYSLDEINRTATIRAYKGSASYLQLPEQIDGCTVTGIDQQAFGWNKKLVEIILPETVEHLGDEVFRQCVNLRRITLPDGLISIGAQCFAGCSSLSDLTLPATVEQIGSYAFEGCLLDHLVLPERVIEIADGLCAGTPLLSISMGDQVTSIGSKAFSGCDFLKAIDLPETVQTIGDKAFYACERLESVAMGNQVTAIGAETFRACKQLTELEIPDSVTALGDNLFTGCIALNRVKLPNACAVIPFQCFDACTSLASVVIPEGVQTIEGYAFGNCESLNTIYLPKSLRKITGSFSGCSYLTTVYYAGTEAEWKQIDIPRREGNDSILDATIKYQTQP